jgi:hypothetical protein
MKWLGAIALGAAAAVGAVQRGPSVASEEARAVLRENCGPCHHGESPQRKAKAIAIFDSRDKKWFVRLGDAQLRSALRRVSSMGDEDEKAAFAAFVAAEISARKRAGSR